MQAGRSMLLLGPPGSGKSTFAKQVLQAEGSGLIALAPGLDEEASYAAVRSERYKLQGFDDSEFYPSAGSWKATGYDTLIGWLRGVYAVLLKEQQEGKELRYAVLVTDTFNAMCEMAKNKALAHMSIELPPAAMSPNGAAFWGHQRNLCEGLLRACRAIRGLGLHWIATCHIAEKEVKETAIANAENIATKTQGIVPAISGGFRDVMPAAFDLVLHMKVLRAGEPGKPPVYAIQWQSDAKRPTKSRYGALTDKPLIAANYVKLRDKLRELDAAQQEQNA
jgi:energy-coupling factor transporter ATP-binding protein EcfA2